MTRTEIPRATDVLDTSADTFIPVSCREILQSSQRKVQDIFRLGCGEGLWLRDELRSLIVSEISRVKEG